jgi:putative transposase
LPLIRSRKGKGKGKGKGDNARFPPPKPENLLKSACLMPRQARVVAAGVPHHITHRGNNRQDVFLSDEDRRRYQNLLRDQLEPCAIELLGWCWMTNHVHLVAIPKRPDSLAKLILRVHSRYAQAFHRRYKRTGHLWHSAAEPQVEDIGRSPIRAPPARVGHQPAWEGWAASGLTKSSRHAKKRSFSGIAVSFPAL